MNKRINQITGKIIQRSRRSRADYLARINKAAQEGPNRAALSCSNLAHGFAACPTMDKISMAGNDKPNIAIISSYNDILSAHQPYRDTPELLKTAIQSAGGVGQFAGGVPAMCDGVTQGRPGMELSLFSRDVIAMTTALALTHNLFDGALLLGICDKIVPGLLIGALCFGHLPIVFIPAGPMPSGLSNLEKSNIRQQHAGGNIGRNELIRAEAASYHSPGTCTFYGTANSNQLLIEVMGLQLPGSSFVNPGTPLRTALSSKAATRVVEMAALNRNDYRPIGMLVDEKAIVNALVGLTATGGSTNHTLHLVAIAQAAGIQLTWEDFAEVAEVVPLLARIYPNGRADINQFHAAGGMAFLISTLLDAGLLHENVLTVAEKPGLNSYRLTPELNGDAVIWKTEVTRSKDENVLRPTANPFEASGGLVVLKGNLGTGIMKISSVALDHRIIEAPAIIFNDQSELVNAFNNGELVGDFIAVVRNQGPQANGMPEMHKLTPYLGLLQDRGQRVALITDGRMSGASGKVPAVIHLTPESVSGGPISRIRSGDIVHLDANTGKLDCLVLQSEFNRRTAALKSNNESVGHGRELFTVFRRFVGPASKGASIFIEGS